MDLPDAGLRAFVEEHCGRSCRFRFCGWEHAASRVWAVEGQELFLKAYRARRKFEQERRALRAWTPQLPGTPRLVALRDIEPWAVLLSAVPGSVAQATTLDADEERELHRLAGAWLRRLHELPHEDDDPIPLAQALRRRAESWLQRAECLVEEDLRETVAARARDLASLGELRRVPCHRDFSPRNWLVRREGGALALGVIDFEHARGDCWLQDLDRLRGREWRARGDLEDAFHRGYGRRPDHGERRLQDVLLAVGALSTVVWAREHGDAAFEAHGRRLLAECCAD